MNTTKLFVLLFLFIGSLYAQETVSQAMLSQADTSQVFVVKLNDGSSVIGRINNVTADGFEVETTIGRVAIPYAKAVSAKVIDPTKIRDGYYWFPNPNQTRLFLAPTGRMLKKGNGYFQNIYLFFNGLAYGITDNVTIGGGMSVFPVDDFLENNLFYFTPKFGKEINENVSLAAGAIIINPPNLDEVAGLAYGVGTFGNETASFTGGLAFPFAGDDLADQLVIMLGGDLRVSRRTSLISENWIITGDDGGALFAYGIRFFGEQLSVDLAFANVSDSPIFPGVPYVDFVFNF
ncbi:MAG: hypothetical protein AAFP70_11235 [Calditrichota bacterium]